MAKKSADLVWNHNNGVVFVFPHPTGKLASLYRNTQYGEHRGWVFADTGEPRYHNFDQVLAGFVNGSKADWFSFKLKCISLELTFQRDQYQFVPFSNPLPVMVKSANHSAIFIYDPREIEKARKDFPCEHDLARLAKQ